MLTQWGQTCNMYTFEFGEEGKVKMEKKNADVWGKIGLYCTLCIRNSSLAQKSGFNRKLLSLVRSLLEMIRSQLDSV